MTVGTPLPTVAAPPFDHIEARLPMSGTSDTSDTSADMSLRGSRRVGLGERGQKTKGFQGSRRRADTTGECLTRQLEQWRPAFPRILAGGAHTARNAAGGWSDSPFVSDGGVRSTV